MLLNVVSNVMSQSEREPLQENEDRKSTGKKSLSFGSTKEFESFPKIIIEDTESKDESLESDSFKELKTSTSICSTFWLVITFSIVFIGAAIAIMVIYHEVLRDENETPIMLKPSKNVTEILDHSFDCYAYKGDGFCDDEANNLG